MKKFSHWVFDLDGTIINSNKYYELSFISILADFSISPTAEEIERAYKFFNPQDYFATFNLSPEQINRATDRLIELNHVYAKEIPLFDGILDFIDFLHQKNVRLSVWTGRELSSAKKILEQRGLNAYISACVGRTCVEKNKPYPDGLLKILTDSRYHVDDVVMIGDHEYDMMGAQAAGVKGISVNWEGQGHPNAHKLSQMHFDQVKGLKMWAEKIYL
jgi:HAD superfamily hydrolase (TIGR01549 family)